MVNLATISLDIVFYENSREFNYVILNVTLIGFVTDCREKSKVLDLQCLPIRVNDDSLDQTFVTQ